MSASTPGRILARCIFVLVFCAAGLVYAVPTTFGVGREIGIGSIAGTIVTNGTVGALAEGDVLDWNLVLDNGAGLDVALTGPLSGANSHLSLGGTAFYATIDRLLFDTTQAGAWMDFQKVIGSARDFWCLTNASSPFYCGGPSPGEDLQVGLFGSNPLRAQALGGQATIGELINVQATPEPATLALFGLGLAGLGLRRRSKA